MHVNDDDTRARCDICLDPEPYSDDGYGSSDDIVYCEGCNALAHKSCYGNGRFKRGYLSKVQLPDADFTNGDPWVCERCFALLNGRNPAQMQCTFCPDNQGLIVKAKLKDRPECKFWAHVTCINYICGVWF